MTKHEDMCSIMAHLQQYVPVQSQSYTVEDPASDEKVDVIEDKFHYLLFGGDQYLHSFIFTGNMESLVQNVLWIEKWNTVSSEEFDTEENCHNDNKI